MKKEIQMLLMIVAIILLSSRADNAVFVWAAQENQSNQTQESVNAQGFKIVRNPRWEYSETARTYKLIKSETAEGTITYYTSRDGVLQLGTKPGCYYGFDGEGNLLSGLQKIGGVRYYFIPKAKSSSSTESTLPNKTTEGMAARNQWVKIENCWYYFNNIGQQDSSKKGLQKIGDSYYYLNQSFVPYTKKWVKQKNGAWWYFGKNGKYNDKMIGSRKIGGSWYYLKKKGVPAKQCFKSVNGRRFYYGASGKRQEYTGWRTINGRKYYFHSKHYVVAKTGWQTIRKKKYYFSSKGVMYAKKWLKNQGKMYYFKAKGDMASGWTKINGTYYYFRASGALDSSTVAKQGKNYYFVTPQGTRGTNILRGVGVTDAMSKETKLRVCFNYVVKSCRYVGGVEWPPEGWEPYHAYKMLNMKMGNCYDYAAAFCYLAKAVGYEKMICVCGQASHPSGLYTAHGWCELNGRVFDPKRTISHGINLYNVSYGQVPFVYKR